MSTEHPTKYWAKQDRNYVGGATAWCDRYWSTVDEAYRTALVEAVQTLQPFGSIAEIGCHCGVNLRRFRRDFGPTIRLIGWDVNTAALEYGRRKLGRFRNVSLVKADYRALTFRPNQWDVIVASSALCYCEPEAIGDVVANLKRGCRRGLVLLEPTGISQGTACPEWRYHWQQLLGLTETVVGKLTEVYDNLEYVFVWRKP